MSIALAIFVKTPSLSPVKTRLAQSIGEEKAVEFFMLCLDAIKETAKKIDADIIWAVAEKEGCDAPLWSDFKTIHTGEGGLGERQDHIYKTLLNTYERVFLSCADAPQLCPYIFQEANDALNNNDFVIGPAHDGGYYLFGGRKPVERNIWTSVPWSTEETRAKLVERLPSVPAHLQMFSDIDRRADLRYLKSEMPAKMSDQQRKIVDWITENGFN